MLTFQITDRAGTVLRTLLDRRQGEVIVPLNDSRTAKVSLSIYDDSVKHVIPLARMLRVFYLDYIVFWGQITTPTWNLKDPQNSTVEVQAHDPSLAWKMNFLRWGDLPVEDLYPLDGDGIRMIANSANPGPGLLSQGVPHSGIKYGYDSSIDAGPKPTNYAYPEPESGLWGKIRRGENVHAAIQKVCEASTAPDWELLPIDVDHPGREVTWSPGYYAELNTYALRMTDRSERVVFHKGFGKHNADEMTYQPDGMRVCNYAVVNKPGGEEDSADVNARALSQHLDSMQAYGIMERWESSNIEDVQPRILQHKADQLVEAYNEPPPFITVVPSTERRRGLPGAGDPYRYRDHYEVGDRIGIAARQGEMPPLSLTARVMNATLSDEKHGAPTKTTLDTAPTVKNTDDPGDPIFNA
jgi:hypothetical protein